MFKDAQIGDRVWDFINGWGTIININSHEDGGNYPIIVESDCDGKNHYTLDGKRYKTDNHPRLFWNEIKFEVPEKPFNLEEALRKLEVVDFKVEDDNYLLCWSPAKDKIDYSTSSYSEEPLTKYFSTKSILKFIQIAQDKGITKEEFFKAYRTVFFKE